MPNIFDGISFNGLHSYRDYGLFLAEPPDYGTPSPKVFQIDIPGANGVLDYTDALTGEVMFNNRTQKYTFSVEIGRDRRELLKSRIRNNLHGKRVKIIPDEDSEWYYVGRATVQFADINYWKMKVVVNVDAEPYKLAVDNTILEIEPANFTAEIINLGPGESAGVQNTNFTFGTAKNPLLDLSYFTKLSFRFQQLDAWGTPSIQIVDGDGTVFNTTFQPDAVGTGFYEKNLPISEITTIDKTRVYRILCQGRSNVELTGTTQASASVLVPVDRMTVVPIWTASEAVTVLANGREFSLPAGESRDYNLRLTEGENQISFIADSENATVRIQYQDGRL